MLFFLVELSTAENISLFDIEARELVQMNLVLFDDFMGWQGIMSRWQRQADYTCHPTDKFLVAMYGSCRKESVPCLKGNENSFDPRPVQSKHMQGIKTANGWNIRYLID